MAFNLSNDYATPLTAGFDASTAGMSAFDPGKNAALATELASNALNARAEFKGMEKYSEALARARQHSSGSPVWGLFGDIAKSVIPFGLNKLFPGEK